jgi:hypothetical protein
MRIINRAVHYGQIVNDAGRSVPWTHIVSGVLRMELVTDIIRGFERQRLYSQERGSALLLETLMDLNPLRSDWFERRSDRIIAEGKIDNPIWEREAADLIARSDAIRYLHLGNPEAIVVSGPKVLAKMEEMTNVLSAASPV